MPRKEKEEFLIEKTNKEKAKNSKMTDSSPAQVETNGPKTRNGIIVNSLYVKMRKEPSFESETLGILRKGDQVEIHEEVDKFYKARPKSVHVSGSGIVYIDKQYVKEE